MTPPIPFPPGSLILPYLRDSGGPEQDASVERQRAEIAAWASSHDLLIPRWYFDPARSGRSTAGRDQFLQLIQYLSAERRQEKGVVFWEYARLARDFDDTMYYLADLRRQGYVVWSITDAIPDTLEGRLLESIIAWKNAKYLQDLSRAIRSGFRHVITAHQGYPQRQPPLGYQKDPIQIGTRRDGRPHIISRLIPDPAIAPVVQEAFRRRAAGATYAEIHNALHLTAYHVSLSRILNDPIYIGTFQYGGQEYRSFCPPLIPQELWEKVQSINQERRSRFGYNHPRTLRSRFVLTGLIFCDYCGSRMHGRIVKRSGRPNYDYYTCRNRRSGKASTCKAPLLPKSQVETLVYDKLESALLSPEIITPLFEEAMAERPRRRQEQQALLAHLERLQDETQRSIQNLLKAISESGHSRAMLDKLSELEKQRDDLATSIASSSASATSDQPIQATQKDFEVAMNGISRRLRQPTRDSLAVLRGLVVEVRAKKQNGGSHYSRRAQPILVKMKVRLPLVGDSHVVSL